MLEMCLNLTLKLFLQIAGRTAASLRCGRLPLAAGLCAVTLLLLYTLNFFGLISRFVFHKLETFYLMNVGSDLRKYIKCFGVFFIAKRLWKSNVIGGGRTQPNSQIEAALDQKLLCSAR